jgi:chromosome segregation ATPase
MYLHLLFHLRALGCGIGDYTSDANSSDPFMAAMQSHLLIVEQRQAELESAIGKAEKRLKKSEDELSLQLAEVEQRLCASLNSSLGRHNEQLRTALHGVLELLTKEEERRVALEEAMEHRAAVNERAWRAELLAAFRAAEASIQASLGIATTRAEDLSTAVDARLAGLTLQGDALAEELEALRRAASETDARVATAAEEMAQRTEASTAEYELQLGRLRSAIDEASAAAAAERAFADGAARRLELAHEVALDEQIGAARVTISLLRSELVRSDAAADGAAGAIAEARGALATAQEALHGAAGGTVEAVTALVRGATTTTAAVAAAMASGPASESNGQVRTIAFDVRGVVAASATTASGARSPGREAPLHPLDPRRTPLGAQHGALDAQHGALDPRRTPLGAQHGALDAQHGALDPRRTPLGAQHGALDAQHGAFVDASVADGISPLKAATPPTTARGPALSQRAVDELTRATDALCEQSAALGVRVKEVEASVAGAVEAAQDETSRAARIETALALLEPQLHALHASVAHFERAWPRVTAERNAAQEEAARHRFDAQGMRAQLSELTSAHARLEREMELAAAERLEYAELALMASDDL